MRAWERYREAERLIEMADGAMSPEDRVEYLAAAQVHATLALAGATAMASYVTPDADELAEWELVAGGGEDG